MDKRETERLTKVETKLDLMYNDIKEIKQTLKENTSSDTNRYENLKEQYASKWVEKVSIGILISIASGLVVLILGKGGL